MRGEERGSSLNHSTDKLFWFLFECFLHFRLRELLEAEENKYFAEMEAFEETLLEKQAKMRERAKLLREEREKERQQLVAEKREQQFRWVQNNIEQSLGKEILKGDLTRR